MKKIIFQISLSIISICLLLVTMSHNSMMSMNPMFSKTLPYAILVLVFALFASFMFEYKGDERDEYHKAIVNQYLLMGVTFVLVFKVFIDQINETYSVLLVSLLIGIILVKALMRWYFYKK